MFEKKKLELRSDHKPPVQINRPLVITIAVVVAVVLLLAVISALTTNGVKTKAATTPNKMAADKPTVVNPELKGLPESYSDIDNIKKYSADTSRDKLALVLQRFNELQNEYLLLRQELLDRDRNQEPRKPAFDPQLQTAKTSGLAFNGVGFGMDNLIGGGPLSMDKQGMAKSPDEKELSLLPTSQQEELFKKQARDAQKLATMKGIDKPEEIYDMHNLVRPVSPYQILAGTLIPATLISGIDTTLDGTVIAQVRSNIYDTVRGKYLLIPKGSKLLGEYSARSIANGQRRVLLSFNRVMRPDGSSISLGKMNNGVDMAGQAGVEGNVDNHWARIIGASAISTILSAGAGITGDSFSNNNNQYPKSIERMFGGGAQSISETGQEITRRAMNIPPTIKIPPGRQFEVAVRRDIILSPFNPKYY